MSVTIFAHTQSKTVILEKQKVARLSLSVIDILATPLLPDKDFLLYERTFRRTSMLEPAKHIKTISRSVSAFEGDIARVAWVINPEVVVRIRVLDLLEVSHLIQTISNLRRKVFNCSELLFTIERGNARGLLLDVISQQAHLCFIFLLGKIVFLQHIVYSPTLTHLVLLLAEC